MNGKVSLALAAARHRGRMYRVSLADRIMLGFLDDPLGLALHHHVSDLAVLCEMHGISYGITGRPEVRTLRHAFIPMVVQMSLFRASSQVSVDTMSDYLREQGWQKASAHVLLALGGRLRPSMARTDILAVGTHIMTVGPAGTVIRFPCLKAIPGDLWSLELSTVRQEAALSCKSYLFWKPPA